MLTARENFKLAGLLFVVAVSFGGGMYFAGREGGYALGYVDGRASVISYDVPIYHSDSAEGSIDIYESQGAEIGS